MGRHHRGYSLERADEIEERKRRKSWPRRTYENLNNSMSGGKQDPISQNKSENTAAGASSGAGMKREAAAEKIESNLLGIPNRGRVRIIFPGVFASRVLHSSP